MVTWYELKTYTCLVAPEPPDFEIGCLQITISGEPGEWFCNANHITKENATGGILQPVQIAREVKHLDEAKRICVAYGEKWLDEIKRKRASA